jgi:predicted XRE-type DNA-binding protein
MTNTNVESYENVWDAIADTSGEAANMQAKTELMRQIVEIIKKQGLKQSIVAKHCGITQPRLNDLLRGRISRFSLDALVNIAAAIGQRVHIELEAA